MIVFTVIFPTEHLFSLRGTPGFCRTSFAIDTDPTSGQSDSLKDLLYVSSLCVKDMSAIQGVSERVKGA